MTKEELEKKRNQDAENHRNDLIKICQHNPENWDDLVILDGAEISFKAGFDSAVSLLTPRLEEAEKLLSNLVNSKVVKNAELIGYSEAYLLARQYLEKKNE